MNDSLIESKPEVMMGKPVIAGARITVDQVLERHAAGESIEQLLEAFPHLSKEAVRAAIDFGNR